MSGLEQPWGQASWLTSSTGGWPLPTASDLTSNLSSHWVGGDAHPFVSSNAFVPKDETDACLFAPGFVQKQLESVATERAVEFAVEPGFQCYNMVK